ncbi:MAG: ADP-ribosylglycohydrolase family protein [Patescibacteria group bacterium]|nr:ADP-ribosylglycohydrolase family protein [Patescibacteria group bacterium]MDE2437792.1 ADP-ribosylglycohydrolase family protein [Patescibacteria group bacterium]
MSPISLIERVHGCLLGVAIGDALGMPWETMTREEINEATERKGVLRFHDAVQQRLRDTKDFRAGDTTDDWQLTKVVARSLIRQGHYDVIDCAQEHVKELHHSTFGWGKSTTKGIQNVSNFLYHIPKPGERYFASQSFATPKGCGNGVAMKISPLALFYGIRAASRGEQGNDVFSFYSDVMSLGSLTHGDRRTSFAAFAFGRTLIALLTRNLPLCDVALESHLNELLSGMLLCEIILQTRGWEHCYDAHEPDPFYARLHKLCSEECLNPARAASILSTATGTGCFALESVPFALGTFLRHPHDFEAGVLEAVNAGGDTDTNASMVGALIGANVGVHNIPDSWHYFRKAYEEAETLAVQLFHTATKT